MTTFVVEGVDREDGSRTELGTFASSGEAIEFMFRYVRSDNAGGWDRLEVIDLRDGEPMRTWEREEYFDDAP